MIFGIAIFMLSSTVNMVSSGPGLSPVVDGDIDPGEYDDGMAVTLVVGGFSVGGYIAWDDQYLYVAVDEPVPGYIEFAFDAGVTRDR